MQDIGGTEKGCLSQGEDARVGWVKKLGARRKGVLTIRGRLDACRAHGGEGMLGPLPHLSLLRLAFQGFGR
jgi:hypothetical protein